MKLTGKVIAIESGDCYTDKTERIMVRFGEADICYRDIRIRQGDIPYKLNDELWVMIQLEAHYLSESTS